MSKISANTCKLKVPWLNNNIHAIVQASLPRDLHFSIPESEARCSSWGNEPSSEDEWIIGIVATSFCNILKATSFKLSYGPA